MTDDKEQLVASYYRPRVLPIPKRRKAFVDLYSGYDSYPGSLDVIIREFRGRALGAHYNCFCFTYLSDAFILRNTAKFL